MPFVLSGTLSWYCNSPINQPFVAFMCLHKQRAGGWESAGGKGRQRGRGSRFSRPGRAVGKEGSRGGKARNVSGHSFVIAQPWTNPNILAVILRQLHGVNINTALLLLFVLNPKPFGLVKQSKLRDKSHYHSLT